MTTTMMRMGLCLAVAGLLAGCGFFDDEDRLEGERIRIRDARASAAGDEARAQAEALPAAVRNADWTQTNGKSDHASGHLRAPSAPSLAWRADAGTGGGGDAAITGSPVIANGRIFTLDAAAQLSAFSIDNGATAWRTELAPDGEDGGDGFGGGLAIEGDRVFATTGFGEVVAVSATSGEVLWRYRSPAAFRAAPAVQNGMITAVNRNNEGVALSAQSGDVLWRVGGISSEAGLLGGASPAMQGRLVVLPFGSGEVMGVDASTGRQVWSAVLGGARRGLARAAISDVTGDPVIAGRAVVAANQSGRIVAIDGQSGRRGWTRSIGSIGPIWAAGQSLFLVSDQSELLRLSLRTGQTIWRTPLAAYEDEEDREDAIAYSGPVLAGGRLLLTDTLGNLLSYDPDTGAAVDSIDLSSGATTGVAVASDTIFVLSSDGTLHAFR